MRFSKFLAVGLCISAFAGFTACNDDDVKIVDGANPVVDTQAMQAWIEGGKDLVVKGTVTDNDGISKIDIVCHELLVNKTIDLIDIYGEAPTSYDLNYKIQTAERIEARDSYPLTLTVTDVAGKKTTQEITVRLDGDQTAPVFTAYPTGTITVLVYDGEPATFDLNFTVSDNNAIDYIEVDLKDATDPSNIFTIDGFPRRINVNKSLYVHSETVALPDDKERLLNISITAYDESVSEASHPTTVKAVYNLSKDLPSDLPLWLCDVENAADLSKDVMGVPMIIDNIAPNVYEGRYYNEKAGTQVCFLGQKGDFGPICIAPSKEDSSILGLGVATTDKFILDQAGVYYKFIINTDTKEYEVSTYSIEEAIDPVMHMDYGGWDLNTWDDWGVADPWWQEFYFGPAGGPGDIKVRMVQDANNPHIYVAENWNLDAGQANFIIHCWHSHGWWNYVTWRCDNSDDPERILYYGKAFRTYPAGTYTNRDTDFIGNEDYFQYRFGDPERNAYMYPGASTDWKEIYDKWDMGSFTQSYTPDKWIKPNVPASGKYKMIFDAHLERAKIVPQD